MNSTNPTNPTNPSSSSSNTSPAPQASAADNERKQHEKDFYDKLRQAHLNRYPRSKWQFVGANQPGSNESDAEKNQGFLSSGVDFLKDGIYRTTTGKFEVVYKDGVATPRLRAGKEEKVMGVRIGSTQDMYSDHFQEAYEVTIDFLKSQGASRILVSFNSFDQHRSEEIYKELKAIFTAIKKQGLAIDMNDVVRDAVRGDNSPLSIEQKTKLLDLYKSSIVDNLESRTIVDMQHAHKELQALYGSHQALSGVGSDADKGKQFVNNLTATLDSEKSLDAIIKELDDIQSHQVVIDQAAKLVDRFHSIVNAEVNDDLISKKHKDALEGISNAFVKSQGYKELVDIGALVENNVQKDLSIKETALKDKLTEMKSSLDLSLARDLNQLIQDKTKNQTLAKMSEGETVKLTSKELEPFEKMLNLDAANKTEAQRLSQIAKVLEGKMIDHLNEKLASNPQDPDVLARLGKINGASVIGVKTLFHELADFDGNRASTATMTLEEKQERSKKIEEAAKKWPTISSSNRFGQRQQELNNMSSQNTNQANPSTP